MAPASLPLSPNPLRAKERNRPQSHLTMVSPTTGLTLAKLVITVAPQKSFSSFFSSIYLFS
jgi:hypothetical protein